jgi:hypothetical protein
MWFPLISLPISRRADIELLLEGPGGDEAFRRGACRRAERLTAASIPRPMAARPALIIACRNR